MLAPAHICFLLRTLLLSFAHTARQCGALSSACTSANLLRFCRAAEKWLKCEELDEAVEGVLRSKLRWESLLLEVWDGGSVVCDLHGCGVLQGSQTLGPYFCPNAATPCDLSGKLQLYPCIQRPAMLPPSAEHTCSVPTWRWAKTSSPTSSGGLSR